MNNYSKTHRSKGLSVAGFWEQMKDKTAKTDREAESMNSGDASNAEIKSYDAPETNENWETRFEAWLDRL